MLEQAADRINGMGPGRADGRSPGKQKNWVTLICIDQQGTNRAVIMFAASVKTNGEVAGVLVGPRDGVALNEITDQMT